MQEASWSDEEVEDSDETDTEVEVDSDPSQSDGHQSDNKIALD